MLFDVILMSAFRLVLWLLETAQTSLWMTPTSGTNGPRRLILTWTWSTAEYVLNLVCSNSAFLYLSYRKCPLLKFGLPAIVLIQNSLVIDTPRVRKQTRPFSATKDELAELSEGESDNDETKPKLRRNYDRLNCYGRTECFRVEKNLLVYG